MTTITLPPPRRLHRRHLVLGVAGLTASLTLIGGRPVAAAADTVPVSVRVTDQNGDLLPEAFVMACPLEAGSSDCSQLVVASVNAGGVARLALDRDVEYDLGAFVLNPQPAWPCPGFPFGGGYLYGSETHLVGEPLGLDRPLTLMVTKLAQTDCMPISVVDDLGNSLNPAGLIICPADQGAGCADAIFEGPDADGIIRVDVDFETEYTVTAYVANSGWPCPSYVSPDGATYHFSDTLTLSGAELVQTQFVIHHPTACMPISVVDDLGNSLNTAGLIICPADQGAGCADAIFEGPDADGVIRVDVDFETEYTVTAYVANSGWPCPWYVSPDGATYHFSDTLTLSGAELVQTQFVIHHPTADECA